MKTNQRLDKDAYYLNIARDVAKRSTCLRSCYGAVIVKNDEIIATGYNGAPRGRINCIDCGFCLRTELNLSRGERYELCRSVHAEANAIISADRQRMIGSTLYLSGFDPYSGEIIYQMECCAMCKRLIINAGIERVVYDAELSHPHGIRHIDVNSWVLIDDKIPSKNDMTKKLFETKKDQNVIFDIADDILNIDIITDIEMSDFVDYIYATGNIEGISKFYNEL